MNSPQSKSRDELYANWLDWVTTNLGRDGTLTVVAANAATDSAIRGMGFNVAADAARTAWMETALAEKVVKDEATRRGPISPLQPSTPLSPVTMRSFGLAVGDVAMGIVGALTVNLLASLLLGLGWLLDWGHAILISEAVVAGILNIGALVISAVVRPRMMYAMLLADLIIWVMVLAAAFITFVLAPAVLGGPGF